jgi:hypothetical protein
MPKRRFTVTGDEANAQMELLRRQRASIMKASRRSRNKKRFEEIVWTADRLRLRMSVVTDEMNCAWDKACSIFDRVSDHEACDAAVREWNELEAELQELSVGLDRVQRVLETLECAQLASDRYLSELLKENDDKMRSVILTNDENP